MWCMFLVSVALFILWCIKWYHLKTLKINNEFLAAQFTPLAAHDLAIKPNFNRHGLYLFYICVGSHRFTTALSQKTNKSLWQYLNLLLRNHEWKEKEKNSYPRSSFIVFLLLRVNKRFPNKVYGDTPLYNKYSGIFQVIWMGLLHVVTKNLDLHCNCVNAANWYNCTYCCPSENL